MQVEPSHYSWTSYNSKERWASYWHQIDEVLAILPSSCLEIGVGTGDVRRALQARGVAVTTVDLDERLGVDRAGDVCALPCEDDEFEAALCAQVLEHLPWSRLPLALSELARVASRRVVVSLPQSGRSMRVHLRLPSAAGRSFDFAARAPSPYRHAFDGQHYWQVGTPGTRRRDIRRAMCAVFSIEAEYTVPENLYHRFYVLKPLRSADAKDS